VTGLVVNVFSSAAAHPAAEQVVAVPVQVISKTNARAEALAVVSRLFRDQRGCQRAERSNCLQLLEGTAVADIRAADKIKVFVPTKAEVDRQAAAQLPVVLEIEAKLVGILDDEGRIANSDAHAVARIVAENCTRCRKSLGVLHCPTIASRTTILRCGVLAYTQNAGWIRAKIDFQRGVEFEEAAHERRPDEIHTSLEGVLADGLGNVIFELVFP